MLLERIRGSLSQFTPAERRVAETILASPHATITWSISDAARICKVSEPSVIRFCRRLGFDGFPDFRIHFAQAMAVIGQDNGPQPEPNEDPFVDTILTHFDRSIASIQELRMDLDVDRFRRAVDILVFAGRVDLYGFGGSGFLAAEAQHRMSYLGMHSVSYSDPTLQMVSATALTAKDAVLVLSFSGATSYLLGNIELARATGARIVSICPTGSAVDQLSDVTIPLNAYRSTTEFNFLPTERVSMHVMLDALMALVSVARQNSPA
jgi:RpiR family carbohydrate utilization transcriptional regulator